MSLRNNLFKNYIMKLGYFFIKFWKQITFFKYGIIPCEYCGGDCYVGDNKEYLKKFRFTNLPERIPEKKKMHIDHLVQCSNGGKGEISNGVVCCFNCNKTWLINECEELKSFYLHDKEETRGPMIDDYLEEMIIDHQTRKPYSL